MPVVYFDTERPLDVPTVYVYVNGVLDKLVIPRKLTTDAAGSVLECDLPNLNLNSDKRRYIQAPIVMYARFGTEDIGAPVFRGYCDTPTTDHRTSHVTLTARSPISWLRNRNVSIRDEYRWNSGEFAKAVRGNTHHFTELLPYEKNPTQRTVQLHQPRDFISYFFALLDDWWQGQVVFAIGQNIVPIVKEFQTLKRFNYNAGSGQIEFIDETVELSPLGDVVFRSATDWGQVLDYLTEVIPGAQWFESFAHDKTWITLAYPSVAGTVTFTSGTNNTDWRELGANCSELKLSTSSAEQTNRAVLFGDPCSCVVTLMTETVDGSSRNIGLLPDYPIFDLKHEAYEDEKGVPGIGTFDYDVTTETPQAYTHTSEFFQPLLAVMENPAKGKVGEPEHEPGWEDVGRRWRLPNWFHFAEIEKDADMFIDPRTGASINYQVFVELATAGVPIADVTPWAYIWTPYTGRVEFDFANKTLTLEEIPITQFLSPTDGQWQPFHEYGPKLARIAVVFTYSHQNWTLYADTYVESGNVIEAGRRNAIESGTAKTEECPGLRFTQISNINLPLTQIYEEKIPLTEPEIQQYKGFMYQEPLSTPEEVEYTDFLCYVEVSTDDGPRHNMLRNVPADTGNRAGGIGTLAEPSIIRDDSQKLWDAALRIYHGQGKRPRKIEAEIRPFTKGVYRGQTVLLGNVGNFVSDMDMVDVIEHDFTQGITRVTTTNQPAIAKAYQVERGSV